jgi:hypothetical protein
MSRRSWIIILAVLASAGSASLVLADSNSDRTEVQAVLDARAAALKEGRIDRFVEPLSPSYTFTPTTGTVTKKEDLKKRMDMLVAEHSVFRAELRILNWQQSGNGYLATVEQILEARLKKNKGVIKNTSHTEQLWIKKNGRWQLMSAKQVEVRN